MTSQISSMARRLRESIDTTLVRMLLVRLMTRNESDPVKRMTDREQLKKNFASIGTEPEGHLAFVMRMMDGCAKANKEPPFEAGLVFGVCMTLAAGRATGRAMLAKMLEDIKQQQENSDEEGKCSGSSGSDEGGRSREISSDQHPDHEA